MSTTTLSRCGCEAGCGCCDDSFPDHCVIPCQTIPQDNAIMDLFLDEEFQSANYKKNFCMWML